MKSQIQKSCIGKFITGEDKIFSLSKHISFDGGNIFFKGKKFATIDESSRIITVYRQKALERNGKRNPLLSHTSLASNACYIVIDGRNKHIFVTDSLGRVVSTEHKVSTITPNRIETEQTKALMCRNEDMTPYIKYAGTGKRPPLQIRDEGGHILADSIGGIPESINIFPQAFVVNHSSKWRGMETSIKKAIEQSKTVEVSTKFDYVGNSKRTSSYTYIVTINENTVQYFFENVNTI
jgi:hypothetical protein